MARGASPAALLLVAGLAVALALAAASPTDYYDYADSSYDDEKGKGAKDDLNYYGDDDALYYDEYGSYPDDAFGYDDYYDDPDGTGPKPAANKNAKNGSSKATGGGKTGNGTAAPTPAPRPPRLQDCVMSGGEPRLSNGTAPCALKLSGVDKHADLLKGGIDGVYALTSCHNGRPLYVREKSPKGEGRVLWYSTGYGDWDISNGTAPNEREIFMYGGDTQHAVVPLYVSGWKLGADLKSDSNMGDDDYYPVPMKVECADGKKYVEPEANAALERQGPVLTDSEIESKYRFVYEKYGRRREPNPTVNLSFIVLLVMGGLATVLAIPYLLVYRKDAKRTGGGYAPVAPASFVQVIQQSKKESSGHIN